MKMLGLCLVLALVLMAVLLVVADALNPVSQQARQQRVTAEARQRAELAPLWLGVKRFMLICWVIICLAGVLGVLGSVVHVLRILRRRATLVYPEHGLYPAVVQREPGRFRVPILGEECTLQLAGPPNEPRAQVVAALVNGNLNRIPASALRPILRTDPGEAMLPEDEVPLAALPAHAPIYTAPISERLALPLGMSSVGPVSLPLRNLGGGVIGGLQGLGKSELVASMMVGLLRQDASGQRVRIALCDMKGGLDFGRMPGDLAALQWPIATDEAAAAALVAQLWQEIRRRQELLARAGCANVESYNDGRPDERLPYLITFVDELMLLTAPGLEYGGNRGERSSSREFLYYACRALAVGRATGVSLIMATQKPSGDVVPTRLRDLAGFRLAFRCATVEASRAVLGQSGAEELPHDPGQAILIRGETPLRLRTYEAGIEAMHFDQFLQRLPRAPRLQLPADAEADGLGADDLPDTANTANTANTIGTNGMGSVSQGFASRTASRTAPAIPPDATVDTLTEAQRNAIWRAWILSGTEPPNSIRGTERILWPQLEHGGDKFYLVRRVVDEQLSRRSGGVQSPSRRLAPGA